VNGSLDPVGCPCWEDIADPSSTHVDQAIAVAKGCSALDRGVEFQIPYVPDAGPLRGSGAAAPYVRFARLIQRRVRVLGVPSARAAFGGNLSLPWLRHSDTARKGTRAGWVHDNSDIVR
jgi:hypothetical protein